MEEDLANKRKVFVGSLSYNTDEEALQNFFSDCGEISKIDLFRDQNGKSKGWAYITFMETEGAENAKKKMNRK